MLGLKLTEVRKVFILQDVVLVENAYFVHCEHRNYIFYFMERVHLPEGFDRTTSSHQKFFATAGVTLCKTC